MTLIADILMIAGALGAAFYCVILSRRLSRFSSLEGGMGGAIAALSNQVSDMNASLDRARTAAGDSSATLAELTRKADEAGKRLEMLLSSMHDLEPAPRSAEVHDDAEPERTGPVFVRAPRTGAGSEAAR